MIPPQAVSTMGSLLLISSAIVRSYFYEFFVKFHLVQAAIVVAAVWVHAPSKTLLRTPTVYLLVGVSLWGLVRTLGLMQLFYRNLRSGRPLSRATVHWQTDAAQVHVKLSRSWKFRAGQYVYLCMPDVSTGAFLQSHPFSIAWWYKDGENDVIVLIVQPRRGFTRQLMGRTETDMKAIIEGPYGGKLSLGSYGTVLLFATGVGIASQLPFIKQLMEGHHNRVVKTRKIALYWEIDAECESHRS
jgi:predicted ferric reductase